MYIFLIFPPFLLPKLICESNKVIYKAIFLHYLSIYLFLALSRYILSISIYLSTYPSIHLSIFPSIYLSTGLSAYLSIKVDLDERVYPIYPKLMKSIPIIT